jgi:divalent metal cation (Fe/Co/Zn/Cd) transporter
MHHREVEAMSPDHLRAGLRVSVASIIWTAVSSSLALVIGARAGSLALVAFGLTGFLDAAGSGSLVVHFRHALRHESFSERHERRALRVVTAGLLVIGTLTAAESARRLLTRAPSHAVPAGVIVAGASIAALALLSQRKRTVAGRIPSRALLADGWLSATGGMLAAVTVAGTALTSIFGWWWADPVAATTIACGAIGISVSITRSSARDRNS